MHYKSFSPALDDQGADLLVQFIGSQKLLDGQVHAIAPVMTRISGDVDTLSILVWQTQFLVDTHPVLERDETEHGRRGEMTAHNILCQPSGQRTRCLTASTQRRVVVILRTLLVLIPPLTQCGHIVGRNRVDRTVGVMRQFTEARGRILRHRLDLE